MCCVRRTRSRQAVQRRNSFRRPTYSVVALRLIGFRTNMERSEERMPEPNVAGTAWVRRLLIAVVGLLLLWAVVAHSGLARETGLRTAVGAPGGRRTGV